MTSNIKTAFDSISAEDTLKANTLLYLQCEIQKRNRVHARNPVKRFAVTLASVAIIILSGAFSYNLYFTPNAYVDVDVNPSLELTLNRFDRVIGAYAYNEDGKIILSGLSIMHKQYEDALIALIGVIDKNGYIQNDGLISVTLQTHNGENELLSNIQAGVEDYMAEHHHGTQIDVFLVDGDTRSQAYELNISPAKYLAIQELIEIDPTASVESCRDHSLSDIKQLTREPAGNHHSNGNADNDYGELTEDENCEPYEGEIQDSVPDNDHHGDNDDNGHHSGDHE